MAMMIFCIIICLLYVINAGQVHAAFGKWEGCPANISTYAGCNVTLKAYFNVEDNNIMCSETFIQFGIIDGMTSIKLSKIVSFGVNGSNDMCEVFSELDKVTPGVKDVIFSAVRIDDQSASNTLSCDDHLIIKDSLPFNTEVVISMIKSVVIIAWSAPSLYAPSDLEGYLVTIYDNQNVTYFQMKTLDNTITVTNLMAGSCVQVNAIYCGEQYSEPILLPLIYNGDQEVAGPENVVASLDCSLLHLEWAAGPSGSLQDHHIDYYTITISDLNLTISTKMTSIEVILDEAILSSLYSFEVNVTVTVCGWSSKASVVEVDIAVPVTEVTYRILVRNESHGSVLLKSKACRGSYNINAVFKCNGRDVVNQSSTVIKTVHDENDDVSLNYILPLNQTCNGTLTWRHNEKQYTFDVIIETLSPLILFTNQADNAQFGLEYLCLFKCCDVYLQGIQTSSASGGCNFGTNFAVHTDDSACDGFFTLRCDNFTVIHNQITPQFETTSFIDTTLTSPFVRPTETCGGLNQSESTATISIAAMLGLATTILIITTVVLSIYILKK